MNKNRKTSEKKYTYKEPTKAQQEILDLMKKGHILTSRLAVKYVPGEGNPESAGMLDSPHGRYHALDYKSVLMTTIKAMVKKGLIVEKSRYMCSSGTYMGHETETWSIKYKVVEEITQ